MDLVKLVAELREYRAQIEEAIAAMEELARRRHPEAPARAIWGKKSAKKTETAAPNKKKKRKVRKQKSR